MPRAAQSRFAAPVERSREEGFSLPEGMLVTCRREGWFSPTSDSVCHELQYVPSPRRGHVHHVPHLQDSIGGDVDVKWLRAHRLTVPVRFLWIVAGEGKIRSMEVWLALCCPPLLRERVRVRGNQDT
jgi:hypothetical protein